MKPPRSDHLVRFDSYRATPGWRLFELALLAVGYYVTARAGLRFAVVGRNVSPVWPASAVALGGLVLIGVRAWPAIVLAATAVSMGTGVPWWAALIAGIGVTLGAVVGALRLRAWEFHAELDHSADLGKLWLAAAMASVLSPSFGLLALHLARLIPAGRTLEAYGLWYIGDAAGIVLCAPALFTVATRPLARPTATRLVEGTALAAVSAIAALVAFNPREGYPFLPFVPLLWSVQRFDLRTTALVVVLTSAIAIWETAHGRTQFVGPTAHQAVFQLYRFIFVFGPAGLIAGALAQSSRRAVQALSQSEVRFRTLFRASPLPKGMVSVPASTFVDANDAFEKTFGWSRDELLGRTDEQIGLWVDAKERASCVERREDEQVFGRDVRLRTKQGGERYGLVSVAPVRIDDAPHRLIAFQDLSDYRMLEQQLQHASRLEAVGQLAAGVAHDFNNLLTVILGCAELAEDGVTDESLRHDLDEIRSAGRRAQALTQQLLAFSRRQILAPRTVDLNEVVRGTEGMLHRLIGEDVELLFSLAPSIGTVKVDRGQIEQVIVNLAVNARDAMPHGGTLTFRTRTEEFVEPSLRQGVSMPAGRYVVLVVADTGQGMDADIASRVFEPFFTTKGQGRGTGLGLSTVYGIVKQSGGYVSLHSQMGHGATFTVYLPRFDDEVERPEEAQPPRNELRGAATILLVEDDDGVRRLTHRMLTESGYVVLDAGTGAEAVAVARAHRGAIDVLFTDVVLPGISGPQLASELASEFPAMRVLYASGYAPESLLDRASLASSLPLIQKPFTKDGLLRTVRDVLARGLPPPQEGNPR